MKYWKHRTNLGKVIYKREKHRFKVLDVVNILARLSNYPSTDFSEEWWAINALHEIVKTAFFPIALRIKHQWSDDPGWVQFYWSKLEPQIRDAVKEVVSRICDEVGAAYGVPPAVRSFVLDNFFNLIWDAIWAITDPLFAGSSRSYSIERKRKEIVVNGKRFVQSNRSM